MYIAETTSDLKGEESGGSDPTVHVAVLEFDGSTRTIIVLDDSDFNALPGSKNDIIDKYNLVRERSCDTRSSVTDLSGALDAALDEFSAHPSGGACRTRMRLPASTQTCCASRAST